MTLAGVVVVVVGGTVVVVVVVVVVVEVVVVGGVVVVGAPATAYLLPKYASKFERFALLSSLVTTISLISPVKWVYRSKRVAT